VMSISVHRGPVGELERGSCTGDFVNLNLNLKDQTDVMNHTQNTYKLIIFPNLSFELMMILLHILI
jgi:hypothetical protein